MPLLPGDVVLIPEIPYDLESICDKLRERNRLGKNFSIIVIGEGAAPVVEPDLKLIEEQNNEQSSINESTCTARDHGNRMDVGTVIDALDFIRRQKKTGPIESE